MTSAFSHGNRELIIVSDSLKSFDKYNNYLKIVIVKSGSGIVAINSKSSVFTNHDLFCFNNSDRVKFTKNKNLQTLTIFFDPSVVNERFNLDNIASGIGFEETATLLDRDSLRPYTFRDHSYNGSLSPGSVALVRLIQLSESILTYIIKTDENYRLCRIRSYFLELILFITEIFYRRDHQKIDMEILDFDKNIYDVILYLLSNYHSKITIDDLTKMFSTNRNNLREKFIKVTGDPVITYLIKLRIRVASVLLKDTSLNISEIMERVGFENISHFGRMFKKHLGISPSKYRQL